MSDNELNLFEAIEHDVLVVSVSGRIDSANAGDFSQRIQGMLGSGTRALVLDLSRLVYLTSAGFRAMLIASDEADARGARFALCSMSATVRELFEMGGLSDIFAIFDSRQEAISGE